MSFPNTSIDKMAEAQSKGQPARREIFNLFSLPGRIAVVTGGSRGIGLEVASGYAEAGAVVYCLDVDANPTDEFKAVDAYLNSLPDFPAELSADIVSGKSTGKQQSRAKKGRLVCMRADVTNQMEMWDKLEKIAEVEGHVDVCVANAGILRSFEPLDYPAEEWKKITNVNIDGVLYTAQAAGRQMRRLGMPGSIILTTSICGRVTIPGQAWVGYETTKGAVLQMGRSLACQLAGYNIRVNTVSPGFISTKMTKAFMDTHPGLEDNWASMNPMKRIGATQEMRGVYLYLASDASSFCTGTDILVSGGHTAW